MEPTIAPGETVKVDLDAYDSKSPQTGDIVTFHPPRGALRKGACGAPHKPAEVCLKPTPTDPGATFLKRIVAGPGDRLAIKDGHPVVNGELAREDFIEPCRGGRICNYPQEVTIPPDHFFVLSDNRDGSNDSRIWGPVPESAIVGEVESP